MIERENISIFFSGSTYPVNVMTETIEYDATKRFVTKITASAAGLTSRVSEFTHDAWGNILTEKSHDGLTTTRQYNDWGRLVKTTMPDGRTETRAIDWDGNAGNYQQTTQALGQPQVTTKYDPAGRQKETSTTGPKSKPVVTSYAYKPATGQLETVTEKFDGAPTTTTAYTYDNEGRIKTETVNGVTTTYTYAKQQTTLNKNGVNTTTTYDGWGNVMTSADRMGNTVAYSYHSSGQPKTITAAGATYTMTYDNAGNREKLIDPDAGTIKDSIHDGLGRVRIQKTAKNVLQTNTYNAWGQLTGVTLGTDVTAYQYDNKGWLTSVTGPGGHSLTYTYDSYGRPTKQTLGITGEGDFETSYGYDANTGYIKTVTYPGNVVETRAYDANGFLENVKAGSAEVWKLNSMTANQTVTNLAGTAMTTASTYTDKGLLKELITGVGTSLTPIIGNTLRNYTYNFNSGNGNLKSRTFKNIQSQTAVTETFAYDSLYRLKSVTGGTNAMTIDYAANGNITTKTGLGAYAYGAGGAGPHAVTSVATNMGSVLQQDIDYTDFLRPKTITQGNYILDIAYGPDRQRIKTVLTQNSAIKKTVIFAVNYERVTKKDTVTHLYYIAGGIYVKQFKGSATIKDRMYYVHPDHLGSFAVITDAAGIVKQQCTFDAWGKRSFTYKDPTLIFDRGYTGHEHLDEFELINMNARLYDPMLGRMLSPDPYVVAPFYSQDYNRYTAMRNNPLIYVDENGEWVHLVIGAVIGGVVNVAANWKKIDSFGKGLAYFGIGAVAGAVGAGVGSGVSSALVSGGSFIGGFMGTATSYSTGFFAGTLSGAASGFSSSFLTGAANMGMQGGSFFDAMGAGWDKGWKGAIGGAVAGGISGGIDAVKADKNFWTGAGKQNVVVNGNTGDIMSASDYSDRNISNYNKNRFKTYLEENPDPHIGKLNITSRVNGITAVETSDGLGIYFPNFEVNYNEGTLLLDLFNGTKAGDHVVLYGWRWLSNPLSIKHLFYSTNTIPSVFRLWGLF